MPRALPLAGIRVVDCGHFLAGPDAHRAGFGLIAEARSGIMQMVGNLEADGVLYTPG